MIPIDKIDDIHSIAIVGSKDTRVDNVLVCIGMFLTGNEWTPPVVLVSNTPNRWTLEDCFSIDPRSLDVDGSVNCDLIDKAALTNLISWVERNKPAIEEYQQNSGMGSDEFLLMLK